MDFVLQLTQWCEEASGEQEVATIRNTSPHTPPHHQQVEELVSLLVPRRALAWVEGDAWCQG